MSGSNDAYDPKQVAALTPEALDQAVEDAAKAFAAAADLDELAAIKPAHLGDRSPLLSARREIGALPPKARAEAGKRLNHSRMAVQSAFDQRRAALHVERDSRTLREEASTSHCRGTASRSAPGTRSPRCASVSPTCSSPWATRSPRARSSRPSGSTSTRSTSPRTTRPARCRTPSTWRPEDPAWCCARTPHRCRSASLLDRRAAGLRSLPRAGVPHRRAGRHPHPGLPPDRRSRDRQGHHHGAPEGHPGRLRPSHVRRHGADPAAALATSRSPSRRAEPDVLASPETKGGCRRLGRVGWLRHGQPATCCAPAASIRTCTRASPSGWASSAL